MDQLDMVMAGLAHCKNDNELGALNCGYCPYDKYKGENGEIDICTSKLCHDAFELLKEQGQLKIALREGQKQVQSLLSSGRELEETINILKGEIDRLKAEQPKHGHWEMKFRHHKSVKHVKGYDAYDVEREIELVEESEGYEPYCSECGAASAESFLCFCPKCGADMRESLKKEGEQE